MIYMATVKTVLMIIFNDLLLWENIYLEAWIQILFHSKQRRVRFLPIMVFSSGEIVIFVLRLLKQSSIWHHLEGFGFFL